MTLDNAITYYEEIAKECRRKADIERNDYMDMRDSASEAEQLASWLNELKLLRGRIDAQPERKPGKWKVQTDEDRPFIWWKCSECGHIIFSESERDRKDFHAFCGRCGADMRERREE